MQNLNERMENITEMENILNKMNDLMSRLETLHQEWKDAQPNFEKLLNYYEGEQWHADYEAYEEGLFPQDFPCGVLSEDAVFDLVSSQHSTALDAIKLSADILTK